MTRKCSKCGRMLPVGSFYKDSHTKDGLRCWCKDCQAQYKKNQKAKDPEGYRAKGRKAVQKWWRKNPERAHKLVKAYQLKHEYGLDVEEYDTMLMEQHGVCAICGEPESQSRHGKILALAVDHDHTTGKIRGLLCSRCNLMVGLMEREPFELAGRAMLYLMKHEHEL